MHQVLGVATIAVAVPADISVFYANAARMVAAVAIIRGYDTESEDVRTAVSVSLIGAFGSEALSKIGVDVVRRGGAAALKKLPGRVLIEINKKVGFRLFTKMGTTGTINLVKAIPLISSGVGATLNFTSMKAIGGYAKSNFPQIDDFYYMSGNSYSEDDDVIDVEIIDEVPNR